MFRSLRPYVKFDVFNLFNNDKLAWNTTVSPNNAGPGDGLGLPTRFVQDPLFGQATSNDNFPRARGWQVAFGFRF